jgi:hypothetical protein
MTCAEFQKVLPYIIETGGNAEEEQHLRECRICSDLVQDLRYIAEQAKLLVPMEEPSPRVWDGIRGSLEREGLVKKPARARGRLLGSHNFPWIAAVVAVVFVLTAVIVFEHARASRVQTVVLTYTPTVPSADARDQQALHKVALTRPALRNSFERNLKVVNTSIRESQQAVERDPADAAAREALQRAYAQRDMLYEMADRPAE